MKSSANLPRYQAISAPVALRNGINLFRHVKEDGSETEAYTSNKLRLVQICVYLLLASIITAFISALIVSNTSSFWQDVGSLRYALYIFPLGFLSYTIYFSNKLYKLFKEKKAERRRLAEFQERYDSFLKAVGLGRKVINLLSESEIEVHCNKVLSTHALAAERSDTDAVKRAIHVVDLSDKFHAISQVKFGKDCVKEYVVKKIPAPKPRVRAKKPVLKLVEPIRPTKVRSG
jgi:hypothetical protein